jgi:hypothetical protein
MLDKGGHVQRLSAQVGWLLCGINGKDVDQPRLDPFAKVMLLLVDVSSLRAHLRGLDYVDGSSIVLKEFTIDSRGT